MPWTVIAMRALVDGVRTAVIEWRIRHRHMGRLNLRRVGLGKLMPGPLEPRKLPESRPGDAFPEFLVLWALIPIVFFSLSQSKLPGYILPSIPPITILTGDYLFRARAKGLQLWVLLGHALLVGVVTAAVLLLPWFVAHGIKSMPPAHAALVAGISALSAAVLILLVVQRWGVGRLRLATCCVMVVLLLFLYGVGPFFAIPGIEASKKTIDLLDRSYSARPLAERLMTIVPANETVAVFRVRRDMEYGLAFYRNHEVANYDEVGVPAEEHILVVRVTGKNGVNLRSQAALGEYLEGRHYEELFSWPEQELVVYLVGSR
jgi:4-amino-4-deoxy-L-arabinose transferase-like glycosyltransferase